MGCGQYGQVFEAWFTPKKDDGMMVAVKQCRGVANKESRAAFLEEARVLLNFSHSNVLGIHGIIVDSMSINIVLEHAPFGDIQAVRRHFESQMHPCLIITFTQALCPSAILPRLPLAGWGVG